MRGHHALTNFGIGVTATATAVVTIPRIQADDHDNEFLRAAVSEFTSGRFGLRVFYI